MDLVLPLASLQASVLSEAGNGFIEAVVVPNLMISVTGMTIIIALLIIDALVVIAPLVKNKAMKTIINPPDVLHLL